MTRMGNRVIPNAHFKKHWQRYVKTWFDQPAKKKKRRTNRLKKAAKLAPRPAKGPLRPIVHCPTRKHNMKVRAGKGFSFQELRVSRMHTSVRYWKMAGYRMAGFFCGVLISCLKFYTQKFYGCTFSLRLIHEF